MKSKIASVLITITAECPKGPASKSPDEGERPSGFPQAVRFTGAGPRSC